MPIDPKDVTDGFWYIERDADDFSIVQVIGNSAWECGRSISNTKAAFIFIAPVPIPIATHATLDVTDTMVKLRQELNLPEHAPVSEVFRAALAFAKQVSIEHRDKNP